MTRVRFAPSPTGNLHLGSARTALYNWLFARHNKGNFIIRIEDTDFARSRPEFERSIIGDVKWLGLNYDEGPGKGSCGPYKQSRRISLYKAKANQLLKEGKAYFCFCAPKESEEKPEKCDCYNRTKREVMALRGSNILPAIRFRVDNIKINFNDLVYGQKEFDGHAIEDFIILRSNGMPTFHLSVVIDDGEMGITHVIRGNDHLPNTPKHILLFKALGYKVPKFAHHSLIMGKDGSKLSKRHGATSVWQYRDLGYLPVAIVNYLALLSFQPEGTEEIFSLEELIKYFDLTKLSRSPAIFDIDKLNWINGQHIRSYNLKRLTKLVIPFLDSEDVKKVDSKWLERFVEATRDDYITLKDAKQSAGIFFKPVIFNSEAKEWLAKVDSKEVLRGLKGLLELNKIKNFDDSRVVLKSLSKQMKEKGIKGKSVFMPVRAALTGQTSGPELFYLLALLDKDELLKRIDKAVDLQ